MTQTKTIGSNFNSLANGDVQTSKRWFVVAILIGSVVVLGVGGFGMTGLLKSHDLISLPQWLTSTIGTVGNTPHFWSLWTLALGGVAVGGSSIAFGVYKYHLKRKESNLLEKIVTIEEENAKYGPSLNAEDICNTVNKFRAIPRAVTN